MTRPNEPARAGGPSGSAAARRPNILFIMCDQLRADVVGEGGDWVRTPALDRLCAEGTRFSNCVTNSPVCVPARVSLATGRYPHTTSVWFNRPYTLAADAPNWMRALRDAGYRTGVFGKTHLHPHRSGGDLREKEDLLHAWGLDVVNEIGGPRASQHTLSHMTAEWEAKGLWQAYKDDYDDRFASKRPVARPSVLPLEDYADVYVGRKAREHIENLEGDAPWFCWVGFGGPHEPWDAPEPYASLYDPADMPDPAAAPRSTCADRPAGWLDERIRNFKEKDLDEELARRLRANYAGNVTLIDEQIAGVIEAVERRGEWNDTVVVFTSDHGELNGDAGLVHKNVFLDGAVRVPLIVRTPDTAAAGGGRVCDAPAELMDAGATMADLGGAALDYEQFARSLTPALTDPDVAVREEAVSEIHGEVMILDRDWKMAVNRAGRPCLLFDRQRDPGEARNLAGDPESSRVEDELRRRLFERLVSDQVYSG